MACAGARACHRVERTCRQPRRQLSSVVLVAGLVLSINSRRCPHGRSRRRTWVDRPRGDSGLRVAAAPGSQPLYDLKVAGRRVFWVAACAGIIVFGSLMGAMFISQQYLQNVVGYDTVEAGGVLPAGDRVRRWFSWRRVGRSSSTRCAGDPPRRVFRCSVLSMPLLWEEDSTLADWHRVRLSGHRRRPGRNACLPLVDRFAGPPSGMALRDRRPAARPWGAIMQSPRRPADRRIRWPFSNAIANDPGGEQVSPDVQSLLTKSFASAEQVAQQYPTYADQITAAARSSFLQGDDQGLHGRRGRCADHHTRLLLLPRSRPSRSSCSATSPRTPRLMSSLPSPRLP